ncbi:hypothetical protein AB0C10_21260 [Microbispora amethystogenes]|uniref:hypothetical protein n=1 Tax=Microbispora amethystogenes TaxID=1427754 RepID=UPI0033DC0ACF
MTLVRALLLAWVRAVFRPVRRSDRTYLWAFHRADGDGTERRIIVMTSSDVRERRTIGRRTVEDRSALPLPPGQTLDTWIASRVAELTADGWELRWIDFNSPEVR